MQSLATTFALAVQSAKGVPAPIDTAYYHALSLESLNATGIFDYIEYTNQARGVHKRASTQQGIPVRSGFSVPFDGSCGFYPNAFGILLEGLGFMPLSTDPVGGPLFKWTFSKMDICDARYISAFLDMPECESSDAYRKIVSDGRITSVVIDMSITASGLTFTGFALDEQEETAMPTNFVADSQFAISPVTGHMTFDALSYVTNPMTHQVTLSRPVDETNQKMHSDRRVSAEESGFTVVGAMTGVDLTYDLYKELVWGGGSTPDMATVVSGLETMLDTGQTSPEYVKMTIPKAEVRFMNFTASGADTVRCDVQYTMIDDSKTDPIVIETMNSTGDLEPGPA